MKPQTKQMLVDWARKMFEAEANWEAAKERYVTLKRAYTKSLSGVALADAETKASSDPEIKSAIAYTSYHREEMIGYATLIQTWHSILKDN